MLNETAVPKAVLFGGASGASADLLLSAALPGLSRSESRVASESWHGSCD